MEHTGWSRLLRGTHKQSGALGVPALRDRPLASNAPAPQPKGRLYMGSDDETGRRLASRSAHPSFLARSALRRQTPKVGAGCSNWARPDPRGGCAVMCIPTAILGGNRILRLVWPQALGRQRCPRQNFSHGIAVQTGRGDNQSAGVIDRNRSRPPKAAAHAAVTRGKKVNGRKRHIITDTCGHLVGTQVHPAGIQDRDGAPELLASIRELFPWLRHVFADGGYAGEKLHTAFAGLGQWRLEIVKRADAVNGFQVLPRVAGCSSELSPGWAATVTWRKTSRPPPAAARRGFTCASVELLARRRTLCHFVTTITIGSRQQETN